MNDDFISALKIAIILQNEDEIARIFAKIPENFTPDPKNHENLLITRELLAQGIKILKTGQKNRKTAIENLLKVKKFLEN